MFAQLFNPKKSLSPATRQRVLDDVRLRIKNAGPRRAIVFGSFADGLETEDSDLDVLVICSNESDLRRCRDLIYTDLRGPMTLLPVDFIFVTEERFRDMSVKGGVCMVAQNYGFDLWNSDHD